MTQHLAKIVCTSLSALALAVVSGGAIAQQKVELKLAYPVIDQHPMSQWLIRWSEEIEKKSGGRIVVKRFPASQMGSILVHYDLARTGQADMTWFLHGGTPGRFPLTEIISLPFMAGSGEIASKVVNDAELRKKYLDAEHKGVKVLMLFTHQPGSVHTTKVAIRKFDDFKGLRLRFATPNVRDLVQALGATPMSVSYTEFAEQLSKGTIDGGFIDYGGAGVGAKLGGTIKYTTELYAYVSSFGLAMNEAYWNGLSKDLQKLIDDSFVGKAGEAGRIHDNNDVPGKKAIQEGGGEAIQLSAADTARVRAAGDEIAAKYVRGLNSRGLPGTEVYQTMRSLSGQYSKTSNSFWK